MKGHKVERLLAQERDRRYTEQRVSDQRAISIKETADLAALSLARDIQTYKDNQHNGLLEQLNRNEGRYATKDDLITLADKFDAQLKPLAEYVTAQKGGSLKLSQASAVIVAIVLAAAAIIGAIAVLT